MIVSIMVPDEGESGSYPATWVEGQPALTAYELNFRVSAGDERNAAWRRPFGQVAGLHPDGAEWCKHYSKMRSL